VLKFAYQIIVEPAVSCDGPEQPCCKEKSHPNLGGRCQGLEVSDKRMYWCFCRCSGVGAEHGVENVSHLAGQRGRSNILPVAIKRTNFRLPYGNLLEDGERRGTGKGGPVASICNKEKDSSCAICNMQLVDAHDQDPLKALSWSHLRPAAATGRQLQHWAAREWLPYDHG